MDRRAFVKLLIGGLACGPLVAIAQPTRNRRRVGFLTVGIPFTPQEIDEIIGPLRQRGWIEDKNLIFDPRYAPKPELLPPLADELVRLKVDLIITEGTAAAI